MKRLIALVAAFAAVSFATPTFAAEGKDEHPALSRKPAAFEHLKSLVGAWEGVADGGHKGATSFEVVANGSAIVERLDPMGESPMINVYHPDGDAVVMTHYCGSGNQPRLRCTKDGSSLEFTMQDITNWKKGEARMSAVTLVLVDADHLKQVWSSDTDGKVESFTMEFTRKK